MLLCTLNSERDFANAFVTAVINWVAFICDRFEKTEKSISEELAGAICDMTERYSSYVQQLAWFLWLRTDKEACSEDLEIAVNQLLDANESLFIQMKESLSEYQMKILKLWLKKRIL